MYFIKKVFSNFFIRYFKNRSIKKNKFIAYHTWILNVYEDWTSKGFEISKNYYLIQNIKKEFFKNYNLKILNSKSLRLNSILNETSVGVDSQIIQTIFGKYNKVGNDCYLYNVTMNDFTYCSKNSTLINVDIGKFCSIGQNVSIALGKHPTSDFVSTHPVFYSLNNQSGTTFADKQYYVESERVSIGNDVWIGANVLILDGVNIANGAVIAANSVVNKDISAYSIVAGSPAKHIRYRFSDYEIAFLKKNKWWEKDISWLRNNFTKFHSIDNLMDM